MNNKAVHILAEKARNELFNNILPFWLQYSIDDTFGGFHGRIANNLDIEKQAPKGLILNTRLLWAFSSMYRFFPQQKYREVADRAFEYVMNYFCDYNFGGFYWTVDYKGQPLDDKKKIYGQAFVIYAMVEYFRAFGHEKALNKAKDTFCLIEKKSYDQINSGYFESYDRDWTLAQDLRLSDKDMAEKKSMNTHLHVLEAYTNLYRVWPDKDLKTALLRLLDVFQQYIIDRQVYFFRLFFDEFWHSKTNRISFGHDIEGSWLLYEAATVLDDADLLKHIKNIAIGMAHQVLKNGMAPDGGVFYEGKAGNIIDRDKHWWPQAEAVVGFLSAFQLCGDESFLIAAYKCWEFIENSIIDKEKGEWFWKVLPNNKPDLFEYKVSEWKGPYHNVRACLEVMQRASIV